MSRDLAILALQKQVRVLVDALERINSNAGCLVGGAMCSPQLCPGCIARTAVREAALFTATPKGGAT